MPPTEFIVYPVTLLTGIPTTSDSESKWMVHLKPVLSVPFWIQTDIVSHFSLDFPLALYVQMAKICAVTESLLYCCIVSHSCGHCNHCLN